MMLRTCPDGYPSGAARRGALMLAQAAGYRSGHGGRQRPAGHGYGCGRGGSGGLALDGRSETSGGPAGGRDSTASMASRTAVSNCTSRPSAQSWGEMSTSTSGSTPWFSSSQPKPSSQMA